MKLSHKVTITVRHVQEMKAMNLFSPGLNTIQIIFFQFCFRKIHYSLNMKVSSSSKEKEGVTWDGPDLTPLVSDRGGGTGVIDSSIKNRYEQILEVGFLNLIIHPNFFQHGLES